MEVRMDFDDMVEKMTKDPENKACSCAEGYLPIYHPETGFLMRCHDPIIKTATLGKKISFLAAGLQSTAALGHVFPVLCVTSKLLSINSLNSML